MAGFDSPGKAKPEIVTIEITDTSVQHSLSSSEYMSAVVEQLFPAPLRYRLAWHDAHAKPPLYIWRPVPPSPLFVAVGMLATTTEEPPELTAMSCLPRRFAAVESSLPRNIWRHGGQVGGRSGSFWSSGPQLQTLLASQSQSRPTTSDGGY